MPEGGDQNSSPSSNWPVGQGSQGGDAESLFNRGLDQHDQGLYDEAIESYKRAIELDPKFVVANNNLGMVYIDKEMFPEAIAAFDRTIELDPSYAEAHNNLGFVCRRLGDDAKAAVHYTKFIELEPDVEDAQKIRAWIERARGGKQEAPAKEDSGGGAAAEPAPPETETEPEPPSDPPSASPVPPPAAATDSGGEPAAADPWAEQSTREPATPGAPPSAPPVSPTSAPPPAGPPPGLPPQQPAAVQAPPPSALPAAAPPTAPPQETAEAVCEKGIAEFEAGRLEQAEAILRQAATMNPALAVARSALGRVLAKADRQDEAVEELRAAVSLDPTDAAAYYVLGFALRSSGQDHDAGDAYERYLELTPDASEGPQIRSWIEEVQAAQLTPGELYHRALTLFQDGALDEALEACQGALAVDETDPQANILMGRILIQKGDSIHAMAVLKRAQRRDPDDPEACFYLGQAYEKRGLMDEARQAYEQCLVVSPTGPQAEAVRGWLERAQGPGEAPSPEARCEYCFRGFPEDQLSRHEGKRICRDCLKNLGLAEAPVREAKVIQHAGVERVAAAAAARAERQRLGARIFRWTLTGVLGLFLVLLLLLLGLRSGWLEGPFRSIGVHGAVRALGLEDSLAKIGIHLPEPTGPEPSTPDDTAPPPGTGVSPPTKALALAGPGRAVGAAPFGPFELQLKPEGGKGDYRFRKVSGPDGMKVDQATGVVSWRPLAGVEKLELPSRHEVEVEVSTAGGESARARFEIVVNIGFEPGPEIDVGARAGDRLHFAVGKLGVSKDRKGDDIAVVWGSYRKGFLVVVNQQEPGRFEPAEPVSLGGEPSAVVLADFTGDGRDDVAVANWYASRVHLFRQGETEGLTPDGVLPTARGVSSLTAGDVDGDGRTDLLATHWTEAQLHVYLQRKEDARWRLGPPVDYPTTKPSGWNRVFTGPLRGGSRAVYLMCGSGREPLFKVFPVLGEGKLQFYKTPKAAERLLREMGERPLEARAIRRGDGPPCIAALVGERKAGAEAREPALYIIGAKSDDLEIVAKPAIGLAPQAVTMAVGDLNADGADDVVVLYPEELGVYLSAGPFGPGAREAPAAWGPYHAVARVKVRGAVGPVALGRFSGDGVPDILVGREDGKLQVVRAFVGAPPRVGGEGARETKP